MYSIAPKLTVENIFKEVDSYTIFRCYSKNFVKLNRNFPSDFREDKSPSANITFNNGDYLYTDFGDIPNSVSSKGSYRAIQFVMRLFNLSFLGALEKINDDFGLRLGGNSQSSPIFQVKFYERPQETEKTTSIIKIREKQWNDTDLGYWTQYGWTKEMLSKANIKPIDYYWLTNNKHSDLMFYVGNKLAFSIDYYWHDNIFRRKLYFPNSEFRFISNIDNTVVQGWNLLPKGGNILFITKGIKDVGSFNRIGFSAIAPNNEKTFIPEKVFFKLKERYKHIILWFDNDETGILGAKMFSDKYNLPRIIVPINSQIKDPSDYVKSEGLRGFSYLVKEELIKLKIK